MSVRKRTWTTKGIEKSAWIVDYVDAAGKRRQKSFARKKEADAWAARAKTEVGDGVHVPDRATVTVAAACERYLKVATASGLERSTLEQYRQHVYLHIIPFIGTRRLNELTVPLLRDWQDRLRSGDEALPPGDKRAKARSARMVTLATGTLGRALSHAQDRGLVVRNAVAEMSRRAPGAKSEKRTKKRLEYGEDIPTLDEIRAIVAHASGRWRPILLTAIFTGLRSSELRGLRWADVDLDAARLQVRQRADVDRQVGPPKSVSGRRTVPLPPLIVNVLREWFLACPKGPQNLVFPNGRGNVEERNNIVERGLKPVQIAAGVTRDTGDVGPTGAPILVARYPGLHALRHWYASWCINRRSDGGLELPPKSVQERLGHASITITMDTYGHLFPALDEAEAMAAAERSLLSNAT